MSFGGPPGPAPQQRGSPNASRSVVTDWLCGQALPLWSSTGWDATVGMFIEQLDLAGRPLPDVPRRAMVQARQIFVFCLAHEAGWAPDGAELARRAGETLLARYQADGRPGWAFSVDRYGSIVDPRRDLYAQAFVLLAFACLTRLDGDRRWLDHADATLAFLDRDMATPQTGGYLECLPAHSGPRRQNPHMHLLEALLALHESDPDRGYLARVETLVQLCETRFLCGDPAVLVEYFTQDWSPEGVPNLSFEPGHCFEWAWLLDRHARLGGKDRRALARYLYARAKTQGLGPNGLVLDEVDANGLVLKGGTRVWGLCEAARAATCGFGKPDEDRSFALACLDALHASLLGPAPAGSWIDHIDADGRVACPFAPASSLYHICGAVSAVDAWET